MVLFSVKFPGPAGFLPCPWCVIALVMPSPTTSGMCAGLVTPTVPMSGCCGTGWRSWNTLEQPETGPAAREAVRGRAVREGGSMGSCKALLSFQEKLTSQEQQKSGRSKHEGLC